MRYLTIILPTLLLSITLCGCDRSPVLHKVKGQVTLGGEPLIVDEDDEEHLSIKFVPINEDGSPPKNMFFAQVDNATGNFTAVGGQLKGVPAGTYRVSVELLRRKRDQFNGKYDSDNSPFTVDVETGKEFVIIDLDEDDEDEQSS